MPVRFAKLTKDEMTVVERIAWRAAPHQGRPPFEVIMDISAVHARMPLRLAELAEADDFNFFHDVQGILRHLNRETGRLENCFVPRFAA